MTNTLDTAKRLRALLPHVTTDPEAEAWLDEVIAGLDHGEESTAFVTLVATPEDHRGKWAWYLSGDEIHGPFETREDVIADINALIASHGSIDEHDELYIGQYVAIEFSLPLAEDIVDEILSRTEEDANDMDVHEEYEHDVDNVALSCPSDGLEAFDRMMRIWFAKHVRIDTPQYRVAGVPYEDCGEIVWLADEEDDDA